MKEGKFLWLILVSVAINRVCSLLPAKRTFDPFPLYDITVSWQYYAYVFANHLSVILVWIAVRNILGIFKPLFAIFIFIEVLSLVDFILIYEHPWFHIGSYGIEFTDLKIIMYATAIIKWNNTGNS